MLEESLHLKKALDLSTNKIVTACAGAGKTFALTKRFCAILDSYIQQNRDLMPADRLGIQNILVITFTRKAAAEMAERIYRDINTLLNGSEIKELKDQGISLGKNIISASSIEKNRIRAEFSQNAISTIDGFCAEILRENADRIGLDPQFRLVEEHLYRRDFEVLLNDFLDDQSKAFREELGFLLKHSKLANIRDAFAYFDRNSLFVRDAVTEIANYPEESLENEAGRDIPKEAKKNLAVLYTEFREFIESHKSRNRYLTFNDIIHLTADLLESDPELREKYYRRFPNIMIDEFQDTNSVRWKIIRMIASGRDQGLRDRGIFIVGDPKQSIYSFLQADAAVLQDAGDYLLERGEEAQISNDENITIDFNANYRSGKTFIETVINPLFTTVFTDSSSTYTGTGFEPTTTAYFNQSDDSIVEKTPIVCNISVVKCEKGIKRKRAAALNTAKTIISQMDWIRDCGLDSTGKPAIAVLLRKFTNIKYYLQVFSQYNIPFEVVSGRDLFSQQEAFDLYHLIAVLRNPYNDVALTGLLRSPIFCMTDTKINHCRVKSSDIPLFEAMSNNDEFAEVVHLLNDWRNHAKSEPLDRLLQKIYESGLREFGYIGELNGRQRIANIDKMIDVVHKLSLEGMTLGETEEVLKYFTEVDPGIAQVDLPSGNLVQIMTIHQAKGLQFPAVIIPELNSRGNIDKSQVLHNSDLRFGLPENDLFESIGLHLIDERDEYYSCPYFEDMKSANKRAVEQEDKRLLYVAVTRAEYRVSLLAEMVHTPGLSPRSENSWWKKFIAPHFNLPVRADDEEWRNELELSPGIEISYETDSAIQNSLSKDEVQQKEWQAVPEYPSDELYEELSVYDLMERHYPSKSFESSVSVNTPELSMLVGQVFHYAVENRIWSPDENSELLNAYAKTLMESDSREIMNELISRTLDHLRNFSNSTLKKSLDDVDDTERFHELSVTGWIDNGKNFLKISGIIDLLYREGNEWKIVDFKTSRDLSSLESYNLQIRIYQAVVQQIYGITATGYVYFSGPDELFEVENDIRFLDSLFPKTGGGYKLSDYDSGSGDSQVIKIIKKNPKVPVTVINPTRFESDHVLRSLAVSGLMRPDITITTIDALTGQYSIPGEKIDRNQARLIIRKIVSDLSESDKEFEVDFSSGMIELLTDAILLNEEWEVGLHDRYRMIEDEFRRLKKEHNWYTQADVLRDSAAENTMAENTVIVNGMYKTSPLHFELMRKISNGTDFYLVNNFADDDIARRFGYDHSVWKASTVSDLPDIQPECEKCYSIEEEIERAAHHILGIDQWQGKFDSLKIAVSSMEKYVPLIKRIFSWYGIPTRVIKQEPVSERPVSQLILAAAGIICHSSEVTISKLLDIMLHPLTNPESGMWELDRFCRSNGITSLQRIQKMVENDSSEKTDPALKRAIDCLVNTYNDCLKPDQVSGLETCSEKILEFIENFNLAGQVTYNEVSSGAIEEIIAIVKQIPSMFEKAGIKGNSGDLFKELSARVMESEVPSVEQKYGFEIIGFLDSVQHQPDYLFVLGLTEGDFPPKKKSNIYLKAATGDPWYWSAHLLRRWLKLGKRVRYFVPERDVNGESLQPSTFLEHFTVIDRMTWRTIDVARKSPRQIFREFIGNTVSGDCPERYKTRHNDYILASNDSEYLGNVRFTGTEQSVFSATEMDNLMKCPMRYWFNHRLNLRPFEFDPESENRRRKGEVIHKVLEIFGKREGFTLYASDELSGLKLMAETLDSVFEQYGIFYDENLMYKEEYARYRDNLENADSGNMLVRLLNWNSSLIKEFGYLPESFERSFGMDDDYSDITLSFNDSSFGIRGKIDKILVQPEGDSILTSDYKTGSADLNDIKNMWSSQFIIYYEALKKMYPNKRILLVYEMLKSFKKKEYGLSPLTGDFIRETDPIRNKKNLKLNTNPDEEIAKGDTAVNPDDVIKFMMDLNELVMNGRFILAYRDIDGESCKYCNYEKICRKSCVASQID